MFERIGGDDGSTNLSNVEVSRTILQFFEMQPIFIETNFQILANRCTVQRLIHGEF